MPEPRMTISEFAGRIGVHPATLRLWDKKGILHPAIKSPGGTRYYTEQQVREYQDRYCSPRPVENGQDSLKSSSDVILKLTKIAESAGADPAKFLHELSQQADILNH